MQNLSYEEVIQEIENKRRFGNLSGAEITKVMLEQLGHPEKGMNVIHIAGTNGKGSVSAFLCEILKEAGFKTGMFTSPHLVDFRERIRVNGEMISKEDAKRIGEGLLLEQFPVFPTMFDYCLLMAVLYFQEQDCDVVVMETGLGGRLDSTNALGVPKVSVITKIGYDHMAILGNTLSQIASEKAGIIKSGTKLVLESQEKEAEEVLLAAAERAGISDYRLIDIAEIHPEGMIDGEQCFSYPGYEHLKMKMLGLHQYENAVAAIFAAEYFFRDFSVKKDEKDDFNTAIRRGISRTGWKGRMEILSKKPFLMVDGAHNSNGVDALKRSLCSLFPGEKFHFVMGVMADKDYEEMVSLLLPLALDFTTVTVESSRALQGEELAACIRSHGVPAVCKKSLEEALPKSEEKRKEKTIAFGSLYFIGEIEAYLDK